ncbi:IS3 family transposase, partial [Lactobacillus sp. S2-2]|uniref:IS3 family transposase n=1 Tax=Lactobacillus sp. S2-2 TaxID=2692917 RepID=UPI001F023144
NQNINHRVYLSPILDLFFGEILAYEINEHPTTKTVITSLKKAIKKIPSLEYRTTIHSDRGIQYQSLEWNVLLKENKFFKSMSRKGTCLDNASMESFFHLMKTEMMFKKYQSKEELISAMKEWIRYYNEDRIKTKLKGKSPIEYRKFALAKILN